VLYPVHATVLTREQAFGTVDHFELINRGLKLPGLAGWKTNLAIRRRPDGNAVLIIEDELDPNPVEIFGRVIYGDAAEMAHTELVGRPTGFPGLDRVLFFAIRRAQTGYEQNGFHAAVKAIYRLAGAGNFKPEGAATKMAVTIQIRILRQHNNTGLPATRLRIQRIHPA